MTAVPYLVQAPVQLLVPPVLPQPQAAVPYWVGAEAEQAPVQASVMVPVPPQALRLQAAPKV